jgi:hypothetical protein
MSEIYTTGDAARQFNFVSQLYRAVTVAKMGGIPSVLIIGNNGQ